MASSSRSAPQWLLVAVPAACLASSYLVYRNRRTLYSWAYALIAKAGRKSVSGKLYLSGNYGPIADELFHENLEIVEGELPAELEGCYVKTGPNPLLKPLAGYHWFDGDGMLHAVRVKGGKANYCNRYVVTERLQQERAAGRPLFPRLGDFMGIRGLALHFLYEFARATGIVEAHNGTGAANTALMYHGRRLLSLHEGDLPYGVRILCSGLIETMGRMRVGGDWRGPFTAHPKRDPVNDELLTFGYRAHGSPLVTAGVMDEHGQLVRQWGVDVPYPVMMHDMAATEHYMVLLHLPLCFDMEAMVKQNTVPFVFKKELPSRVGLLRRDQPSKPDGFAQVTWFELPGPGRCVMHAVNAWEEPNGDVKVYVCQMDDINLDLDSMHTKTELARLTEYTLSPSTGSSSVRRLSEVAGDFPVVKPNKVTRRSRWAWLATMDTDANAPSFTGIAKMDLSAPAGTDACVGRISYPAGVFGGEAVFVPRRAGGATTSAGGEQEREQEEDDGYMVVYVYDTAKDTSYMNVYDARTMAATPVASVRMPRRVPYGFHGTWVTERELQRQVMWV